MDITLVPEDPENYSPILSENHQQLQLTTPIVSITPASNSVSVTAPIKVPVRPTQLDLSAPKRPARHLRPLQDLTENSTTQQSTLSGSFKINGCIMHYDETNLLMLLQ